MELERQDIHFNYQKMHKFAEQCAASVCVCLGWLRVMLQYATCHTVRLDAIRNAMRA